MADSTNVDYFAVAARLARVRAGDWPVAENIDRLDRWLLRGDVTNLCLGCGVTFVNTGWWPCCSAMCDAKVRAES